MTQLIKLDGKFYDEEDIEELLRLRALLSNPGAKVWLAALPGLMQLAKEEGDYIAAYGVPHPKKSPELSIALRNALHAASVAGKEGGTNA